ncbi:MAG: nitrous oxide-stimulated promoter family protein [Candidatus Bathyarchaeota archaeon]
MTQKHPRIKREKKTIDKMIHVYCKGHHNTQGDLLCDDCTKFLDYAYVRLEKCPFQEEKSTCGKCLVHCYQPEMREKAKKIMRYSGPRLIYKSPILALHHVFDGRKKPMTIKELKEKKAQEQSNTN